MTTDCSSVCGYIFNLKKYIYVYIYIYYILGYLQEDKRKEWLKKCGASVLIIPNMLS